METLRVNKVFLMNTLSADVGYILQHVQQEEIITLRDYRNLNHRNYTNETIVTNLLDCVLHKGPPVCARFVNLLQQREIQETFPQLKQLFSHAPPSHVQDNPERAADEIAEYKMSSIPRGFCLIINNIEFDQLKTRQGSTADEESLKEVFQWLGYSLDVYINQTAQQMKDLLKTYSQKEHSGDSFVCCILSHGLEGGVYGTDGNTICTNDIFRPFNGTSCRSLVNKPKAFFIQACCGDEFQLAVTVQSDNYEEMEAEVEMKDEEMLKMNAVAMITIPSDADCLVAMSTVKGYVSFRDSIRGSWFIQSLYKQLKKYCPKGIDVPTILLSVNQEVGEKVVKYKAKHLVKQMPVHKVTLRKKLVFHVPNQQ